MENEIKALREEIAKLRERVAVLEARPLLPPPIADWTYRPPQFVPVQTPWPYTVTCQGAAA